MTVRRRSKDAIAHAEQFEDTRDYLGAAWYATDVQVPPSWHGHRVQVRVGSANYAARVWANGT
ncbi:MAG: hypothetical protein EBS89_04035 [Proteobacteria bacterium]|nr:hypothetical protein [Pseudomonadota bacterium]